MVESGLSTKQQKADKFQQIKQEVNNMIRTRVSLLNSKVAEQQDGSADDFQEANSSEEKKTVRRYNMDISLEDKICDLYDLYVEGMDEDKGLRSRKLYVELAELWPNDCMDNYGIKYAIFRSKERKRIRVYWPKAPDQSTFPKTCFLKDFKRNHVTFGRLNIDAPPNEDVYNIIVDEIFDNDADLFDGDGKLRDIMLGDLINWPKVFVQHIMV